MPPDAVTLNVACAPAVTVCDAGCFVIDSGVAEFTVSVAVLLVTVFTGDDESFTMQWY